MCVPIVDWLHGSKSNQLKLVPLLFYRVSLAMYMYFACANKILSIDHQSNLTLKKSTKRSLLHLPGRKQKNTAEDLWLRTNKLTDSFPTTRRDSTATTTTNDNTPIDVLHTANALMPASSTIHQSVGKKNSNKKPYDYVDTPGRPLPRNRNSVDVSVQWIHVRIVN